MTDFELIILGFFLGCIFSFVMIGGGVWFGDRFFKGKREVDRDCDCNRCVNSGLDRGNTVCDSKNKGEIERLNALAEKLNVQIDTGKIEDDEDVRFLS